MQKLATAATAMATAMATAAIMASAAHAGDTDPPANTTTTATNTAPAADPVAAAKKDFDFVLAGGYAHFFATDFDTGGGDVAVDRVFSSISIGRAESETYRWDISLTSEGAYYSFGTSGSLAAAAGGRPWHNVGSMVLSPGATFQLDQRWRLITRVLLQEAGEDEASFSDSFTYGGVLAATYSFSREFTLGAGVLAVSQLEDDALVVPQIIIDWRPSKEFRLSNFAGPEAFPGGAGLEAIWEISESYEAAIGARYTYRRFRLDDTGSAARAGGVGYDTGLPMWLRVTARGKSGWRADLVGGLQLMGEMRLYDASGHELDAVDVQPAPFIGVFFSYRF